MDDGRKRSPLERTQRIWGKVAAAAGGTYGTLCSCLPPKRALGVPQNYNLIHSGLEILHKVCIRPSDQFVIIEHSLRLETECVMPVVEA